MNGHTYLCLQMHYRYENARRDRMYGKHVPNTRVDTSELADRVSAITFLENDDNSHLNGSSILTGARLPLRCVTRFGAKVSRARTMCEEPSNCACALMDSHSLIPCLFGRHLMCVK